MKVRQPRYKQIFATHEKSEEKAAIAANCWDETVQHLMDNDLLTQPRLSIVKRLSLLTAEFDILYPAAMAEGPTSISSKTGGQYANMKWAAVGKLNIDIMKLEESLLISPKAVGDKLSGKPPEPMQDAASEFGV